MNRRVINRIMNRLNKRRLARALPGILDELKAYSKGSDTTGTQWNTLWAAVDGILTQKPRRILECGTGSSTIVLAAAVRKLAAEDPGYDGRIVSMESVREWFDIASANLPEKYRDIVTIVHGPREPYRFAFFHGFIHGNIPPDDYDFIFLDGPAFDYEDGTAFCADIFKVMEFSEVPVLRGVIDARVSSVFVLQQVFGTSAVRYYPPRFCSSFEVPRTDMRQTFRSGDFHANLVGGLTLKKFRH